MKFFHEETNLQKQTEDYFKQWFENKSAHRKPEILKLHDKCLDLDKATLAKIITVYRTECLNLE